MGVNKCKMAEHHTSILERQKLGFEDAYIPMGETNNKQMNDR